MICYSCRKAADSNNPDDHCSDLGCTCAHNPVGHCQPVKAAVGRPDKETENVE